MYTARPAIFRGLLAVAILGASASRAQFTSAIEGTVMDPSRAVIPKASLTLTNLETGITASTQTSETGYYRFPSLPAARFRLVVSAPGFKTTEVSEVQLEIGQTRTINFTLEVGAATTAVTVHAEAAAIDLSEARVSAVVESKQLTDLPLIGRNFLALVALVPGVTGSTGPSDVFGSEPQIPMNAAGLRNEQNGFAVDSGNVTSMVRHGRINLQPNAESIQEMRVSVNNFSAEQGNDAGASINVVTRQGTNTLRGTATWFHSNNRLQSRNIFQNTRNPATGRILPVFRRNEAAGSLGGPVVRNRTFFFGSLDILRSSTASGSIATVETPQFAEFVRQRFPANKSSFLMERFKPSFAPVQNFRTAGSLLGVNCASLPSPSALVSSPIGPVPCNLPVTGEGVTSVTSPRDGYQWNARVDHMLGDKDRLYFNVFRNSEKTLDGSTIRPAFRVQFPILNWYTNLNETHAFSSSLIHEFRASVVRVHGEIYCAECQIPSAITITGMSGFGKAGPVPFIQNNYHLNDVLSWVRGSHTIRAGFGISKLQSNWKPTRSYQRPSYSFPNIWDFVNDDPFSQGNIGLNPVDGSVYTPDVAERQQTVSAFIEDSWKLRPNFTLTLGLRWETYGKVGQATKGNNVEWRSGNDLWSRIADGKNVTKYYILDHADLNNFGPRLSFAWDPTGKAKLSVRSGVGVFYDFLPSQLYGGAHYTPPIYMIITASKQTAPLLPRYGFGLSNTDPYQFPRPLGLEGVIGLDERNGSRFARADITWIDPKLRNSYTVSYFFGVQYALTDATTLEANYLGNVGRKLYAKYDVNRYAGDLIVNNGVLRRINPSFGSITYAQANLNSSFNGGTLSVRQRTRRGLMFQAAYTFGKALDYGSSFSGGSVQPVDAWNLRLNRGLADHHVGHKLAFSTVWQIPGPASGWRHALLGGWQLSGVTILQSGGPFSVTCSDPFRAVRDSSGRITGNAGCDFNADGVTNDRPMAPAFGHRIANSKEAYLSGVFRRSDFPTPVLGQTGSLGRNVYFNPGLANTDLALAKTYRIPWPGAEPAQLQFRAEAFNAFNRVNLGGVSSNMAASTFGRVTAAREGRRFQFGLRFEF